MDIGLFDIREKSRRELLQLLRAYQKAIEISIVVSITDTDGTILYANKKFSEISGYPKKELIGQNHRILQSGHHDRKFYAGIWNTIISGQVWHGEIKNKAKDGTYNWADMTIIPIYNDKGIIIQYLALRMSIDERKQSEKDKAEHISALEKMMFMTSHRVRKPVATILGLLPLIDTDTTPKPELKKILEHLQNNVLELDDFTRELTTFIHDIKEKNK